MTNEGPPPHDSESLVRAITGRKERLDRLHPLSPEALARLEHYYDIELTYTSNAIEGNTLSAVETTLVIEKGITIGGKPLKDHLEALDHYEAVRYIRELGWQSAPLTESDIRHLHFLVVQRSHPEIAGRYADLPRYVRTETGRHTFPPPIEVPALMGDFAGWLRDAPAMPGTAFAAHRRLVHIHPFNDGNGRTARLLMNLILIRGGYPPGRGAAGRPAVVYPCPSAGASRRWDRGVRCIVVRAAESYPGRLFDRSERRVRVICGPQLRDTSRARRPERD